MSESIKGQGSLSAKRAKWDPYQRLNQIYLRHYALGLDQEARLFWHGTLNRDIPDEVKQHKANQGGMNQPMKAAMEHLLSLPESIVALGMGLGTLHFFNEPSVEQHEGRFDIASIAGKFHEIHLSPPGVKVSRMVYRWEAAKATINLTHRAIFTLEQRFPQSISSLFGEIPEPLTLLGYDDQEALYPCQNALVLGHKHRLFDLKKGNRFPGKGIIFLDLRFINAGVIHGSSELDNNFFIHDGNPQLIGGIGRNNYFFLLNDSFTGSLQGGSSDEGIQNSVDASTLKRDLLFYANGRLVTKDCSQMHCALLYSEFKQASAQLFSNSSISLKGIDRFIGRSKKTDYIDCFLSHPGRTAFHSGIIIDSRGGTPNFPDRITGCSQVVASAYTEITLRKSERGEVPTVVIRLDQAGFIRIKRSQGLEASVQLLFLEHSFRLNPFKIVFYKNQLEMELKLDVLTDKAAQTLRISLQDYWEGEQNYVERYHLFDQEKNSLEPLLESSDNPEQKQQITRFILRAKVHDLAQHAFVRRYYQPHLAVSQQILTVVEQDERIKLIGSSGADILQLSEKVDFAYGGAGPDIYMLRSTANSSNRLRQIINNGASDRVLDMLVLPSTRNHIRLKARNQSLVIKHRVFVQSVTIKNYFKSEKYQHLAFLDASRFLWMILKDEQGVQGIPYDEASLRHRPLVIKANTLKKYPQRAVEANFHQLQYFRENNDLLLVDTSKVLFVTHANRFSLRLSDYYIDPSCWENLSLLETRNGSFTRTSSGAYHILTGSMLREYACLTVQCGVLLSKEEVSVTMPSENRKERIQALLVAYQAKRLTPDQIQDLHYGLALARSAEALWPSDFYKSLDFSNDIEFAEFIEAYRKKHTETEILWRLKALFSDKQALRTTEYLLYQLVKLHFQGIPEAEIIPCFPLIPRRQIHHFLRRIPADNKGNRAPKHLIAAVERIIKNQRWGAYTAIQRQQERLGARYDASKRWGQLFVTEKPMRLSSRIESETGSFLKGSSFFFTPVNQLTTQTILLTNSTSSAFFFDTTSLTCDFPSALYLVSLFLVKRQSGHYPFLSTFQSLTERAAASLSMLLWEEVESFLVNNNITLDIDWWDIQALQTQWRERLYQSNFVGVLESLENFLTAHVSVCLDYSSEKQKALLDHILHTLARFRLDSLLSDTAQVVDETKTPLKGQPFSK